MDRRRAAPCCTTLLLPGLATIQLGSRTTRLMPARRAGAQIKNIGRRRNRIVSSRVSRSSRFLAKPDHFVSPPQSTDSNPLPGKFLLHAFRVGVRFVDLIDSDHDRHPRRASVQSLRSFAASPVIGGDYQTTTSVAFAPGSHERECL
jgi:hypothetical protein